MTTVSNAGSTLERTTLRAVSRRLIPFLFILYVVSFLDRVNVGFAALEMNRDLGLSPAVYGFGAEYAAYSARTKRLIPGIW